MVSHIDVHILEKLISPNNIGEALKVIQRKFCKEALCVQHDKNKHFNLLLDPIPIKYLPGGTKVLRFLIALSIKKEDCCDACKFVARHC